MEGVDSYNYKLPLCKLADFALKNKLQQIIEFSTWSRIINGVKKESLLDHVYVTNIATIKDVHCVEPVFGDHFLAIIELHSRIDLATNAHVKQNWTGYSNVKMENLVTETIRNTTCMWESLDVQEYWNVIENVLINCVDSLAPLEYRSHEGNNASNKTPKNIKNLINVRNRLLKIDSKRKTNA